MRKLFSFLMIGFKTKPFLYSLFFSIMVILGLMVLVFIELQKQFIDKAGGSVEFVSMFIVFMILYFLLYYFDLFSQDLVQMLRTKLLYRIEQKYMKQWVGDVSSLPFSAYEDANIQNTLMRLSIMRKTIFHKTISFLPNVFRALIELGSILFFLIFSGVWWAFPLAAIFSLPAFHFNKKRIEHARNVWQKDSTDVRYANYLNDTLLNKEAAKERRFFGIYPYLSESWQETFSKYNKNKIQAFVKSSTSTAIAMAFSMSTILIIALSLLRPLQTGMITIGLYTSLLVVVTSKMNRSITNLISEYSNITEFHYYLKEEAVVESMPKILDIHDELTLAFESIEFKDVWFAYPNTKEYVLKGVSFKVNKHEQYALIGVNGAGKTTITKLMLGLYKPTKGEIYLNGKNINLYHYQEIRSIYAAIEQNFSKYKMSLGDNIALYDLNRVDPESLNNTLSTCKTEDLLEKCKNNYACYLTPEFENGIQLSGGWWQKVAISRAFHSQREFIIFDEPTAALDPIAEVEFYDTYQQIMKGKTCLFITHRLGSTYLFNRCLVLSSGKIVESGAHEDLMKQKGEYYKLFQLQKQWYQQKEGDL